MVTGPCGCLCWQGWEGCHFIIKTPKGFTHRCVHWHSKQSGECPWTFDRRHWDTRLCLLLRLHQLSVLVIIIIFNFPLLILFPFIWCLKASYYAKSTFDRFSTNNMHPWPIYNPFWYEKSLTSPSIAFSFFRKRVLRTGGLEFRLSMSH